MKYYLTNKGAKLIEKVTAPTAQQLAPIGKQIFKAVIGTGKTKTTSTPIARKPLSNVGTTPTLGAVASRGFRVKIK